MFTTGSPPRRCFLAYDETKTRIVALYPFSLELNAAIREIPGREFDDKRKRWSFPVNPQSVLDFRRRAVAVGWQVEIERSLADVLNRDFATTRTAAAIRERGDHEIEFDFLTEPYAHQRAGLAFLAELGSGALFWEMGLGKTKTAIDYAEWLRGQEQGGIHDVEFKAGDTSFVMGRDQKVLVICPNTVKRNWAAEIEKHAGHNDWVIPTGSMVKRATQLATARYTIVNCESLSLNPLAKAIVAYPWDLVVVDESTRFKTPTAARTKNLHRMATKTKHRVVLTGTPITGSPSDAWAQLEFVKPGLFGQSFWQFKDHYLLKDFFGNVVGLKPESADELKARIDQVSYRILKEQVLDLPPKVYSDRRVVMDGEQRKAYNQMRDELRIEIDALTEVRASTILTMLLRLTQVTAGLVGTSQHGYNWLGSAAAKVRELDDLLLDELKGEQVVIFGQYQRELEELARRYDPPDERWRGTHLSLPIIYGPTAEQTRAELVRQFQAGDRRLLFVQSRTGGIGITLTAAQTAIYHTRSWSLEEYLQSQDRLHRIGQKGTVSIIHLRAEESIDDDIADALGDKQAMADRLTGDTARKLAAKILAH